MITLNHRESVLTSNVSVRPFQYQIGGSMQSISEQTGNLVQNNVLHVLKLKGDHEFCNYLKVKFKCEVKAI